VRLASIATKYVQIMRFKVCAVYTHADAGPFTLDSCKWRAV